MLKLFVCRDVKHFGSLKSTQEGRVAPWPTLTRLSCSSNVPSASDLDIRTLTNEPIAKWRTVFTLQETVKNAETTIKYRSLKQCGFRSVVVITSASSAEGRQFNSSRKYWSSKYYFFSWRAIARQHAAAYSSMEAVLYNCTAKFFLGFSQICPHFWDTRFVPTNMHSTWPRRAWCWV